MRPGTTTCWLASNLATAWVAGFAPPQRPRLANVRLVALPQLKFGHRLIYEKLPWKTRDLLAMPVAEQRKLLKDRKKLLAARAAAR